MLPCETSAGAHGGALVEQRRWSSGRVELAASLALLARLAAAANDGEEVEAILDIVAS